MKLTPLKKLAFVLGASIMLQGCAAAVVGGAAAGAKVATDPRTMGTQIDDETLRVSTKKDSMVEDRDLEELEKNISAFANEAFLYDIASCY